MISIEMALPLARRSRAFNGVDALAVLQLEAPLIVSLAAPTCGG